MAKGRGRRWKGRLKGWLMLAAAVFAVAVALPRWTESIVRRWFLPTVAAEPGPLEEVVVRPVLALWREEWVKSPGSGVVRPLVAPGQRVQAGQAVAVLRRGGVDWRRAAFRSEEETAGQGAGRAVPSGGDRNVVAPRAGLVRFDWIGPPRPDPSEALAWRDDVLAEIGSVVQRVEAGDTVREGDLLFRIVDNHHAYLLVKWEGGPTITEGKRVWVREAQPGGDPGGGSGSSPSLSVSSPSLGRGARRSGPSARGNRDRPEWEAVVVAARPVPRGAPGDAVLLRLRTWPPGWETRSWFDAEVVVNRYSGTVVPESVLVRRGDRWGVMVDATQGPLFHPVTVVGRVGGRVAVDGLAPGLWVVAEGE